MTDGIGASRDLLGRIEGTLETGTDRLEAIAGTPLPGVDAGGSTSTVAETLGLLLQASAGLAGGMAETAQDVHDASTQYMSDDGAAADLFGRIG